MTKSSKAIKTIRAWAHLVDDGTGRDYCTWDLLSAANVLEAELKRLRAKRRKVKKK